MLVTASQMVELLQLKPHPEGGFFRETYCATTMVATPRGERPAGTAILFLVTDESVSKLHRLPGDELWAFQGGLPLELMTIAPDGSVTLRVLGSPQESLMPGSELKRSDSLLQAMVAAGSWQGARLVGGPHLPAERAWALVGCFCAPGFDISDLELGDRETLTAVYPEHAEIISTLT